MQTFAAQCNRPAPAVRRPEREARRAAGRGRGGAAEGNFQGGHGCETGDAGGWARVKCGCIFPSMLPLLSSSPEYCALLHFLSAVSHHPAQSGGFLRCWDLLSPTTFYPCGLSTPVIQCSLRRSTTARRPVGGTPLSTTASVKGPEKQRAASTSTKTQA